MPPMMPKALARLAALAMDLANTQVMAALNTKSHKPGGAPFSAPPPKNWGADTRFGLNSVTMAQ